MEFSNKKLLLFIFVILISNFNLTEENNVNEKIFNKPIRRLKWEEEVYYDTDRNSEEIESIEKFCKKSDYKYFVNLLSGHRYVFNKKLENYQSFAVSKNK